MTAQLRLNLIKIIKKLVLTLVLPSSSYEMNQFEDKPRIVMYNYLYTMYNYLYTMYILILSFNLYDSICN